MNGIDQHVSLASRTTMMTWLTLRQIEHGFSGLVFLAWLHINGQIGGPQDGGRS